MTSKRNTTTRKMRAVSVIACIALILCAVLSFAFINIDKKKATADSEPNDIRFVQVAAGENFAIGLTYDGDLYGWSLIDNSASSSGSSLGYYYTKTPTKIENPVATADGEIKQIAATRHTAAFITNSGRIYTWGQDTGSFADIPRQNEESNPHYLLLREPGTETAVSSSARFWYLPQKIDYEYYSTTESTSGLHLLDTTVTGQAVTNASIAAGEYNYIVVYQNNSNAWCSFVWGSLMYSTANLEFNPLHIYAYDPGDPNDNLSGGNIHSEVYGGDVRAVYETVYSTSSNITAVAGGYNVGMNGSAASSGTSSLTVRGRNFLTSVYMPMNGNELNVTATVGTTLTQPVYFMQSVANSTSDIRYTRLDNGTYTQYTVKKSILGGYEAQAGSGGTIRKATTATNDDSYYARQATGGAAFTYALKPEDPDDATNAYQSNIIRANGEKLNTGDNANVIRSAVSLGNDVGYGIYRNSSGQYRLYAWGDNTCGQLGISGDSHYDTPQAVPSGGTTGLSGDIVSVAAGKQLSSWVEADTQYRAFNDQVNTIGSFINTDAIEFNNLVKNETDYITGAINSVGRLYLWGNVDGLSAPLTPTEVFYSGGSIKSNASKFVAVYSGYGNNIFAITKLGKVVRFTIDAASGEFKSEIYDQFAYFDNQGSRRTVTNWTAGNNDNRGSTGNTVTFDVAAVDNTDYEPALGSFTAFIDYGYANKNSVRLNGFYNTTDFKKNEDGTSVEDKGVHTPSAGNEYCDVAGDDYNRLSYSAQKDGTSTPFVTKNAIGDVYRILTNDANDQSIVFTNTTSTGSGVRKLSENELTPKFYFGNSAQPMSKNQIANMFDWDFVYNTVAANDVTPEYTRVGIIISPKQSSKRNTIRVEFMIARYDCYGNYKSTSKTDAVDSAVYYDYHKASFEFTINNTPSYRVIEAFDTDANDAYKDEQNYTGAENTTITGKELEQSYLPLLDPLSIDESGKGINNQYSVALMDVTTGVHRLAEYLQGMTDGNLGDPHTQANIDSNALVKDIHDAMKAQDTGYPDKAKIDSGNLNYYLRNATSAYNDKYRFMFKDRDGDLLQIGDITQSGANGITATRVEIPVTVDITNYVDSSLINSDTGLLDITNLYRDFNNKYGFFNFAISQATDGKQMLSFRYDVLRFTATASSGNLRYFSSNVNDYNTTRSGSSYLGVSIRANEYYEINDGVGSTTAYRPTATVRSQSSNGNVAAAFSQSTLRATVNGNVFMGDHSKTHVAETTISTGLAVGKTFTVKLDDYVKGSSSAFDIRFSYNGGVDAKNNYEVFNSLFVDTVGETDYETVVLKRDSSFGDIIEVTPVSTHDIYFTIGIQRYYVNGANRSAFDNEDEKVTLSFRFTDIEDVDLAILSGVQDNPVYISTEKTFDIFGDGIITLNRERYGNKVVISQLSSSDNNILKVSAVEGSRTSFKAEPLSSGRVSIQFIVTVYGKSVFVSLNKVNVSGVTKISDSIELIDTQYVYVNTMLNELQRTNSFNEDIGRFGIIYADSYTRSTSDGYSRSGETVYNAVYFTEYDGTRLDSDNYPSYIKSVRFVDIDTDNPRMRIELDSEAPDTFGSFMLHVRYVDTSKSYTSYEQAEAANAAILETSELIRSSKQIVKDSNNGFYTVEIDCDNPKAKSEATENSDWYTDGKGDDFRAYIPVRYLLSQVGISNPDEYKIFLVTSTEDAANFFNYSSNNEGTRVIINPLYNTEAPIAINVSVRPTTSSSTGSNQVLSFRISVTGISTTLSKKDYTTIWLVAFFASFGVLLIIFIIRLAVYWKRRARQRQLIKRNQELIRMRDRVHNKSTAATREQIVKTKMKMEDPRYKKMLTDMRKEQRAANSQGVDSLGITLESMSQPANFGPAPDEGKGKKKKKGGKKSIAELKAELEAKKAAFAQAQNGDAFGGAPDGGFGAPVDGGFGAPDGGFGAPVDGFGAESLNVDAIVFDAPDIDNGSM